ncbi:Shikimate kinase [Cocos nucifera]|uniref:Shikimate kinase n=1 Tax=Cocos nucifera TaxID=13894 RepID=A0A8K0I6L8_COCNU|nr:Shikimate kinase [Cocos nucifera]
MALEVQWYDCLCLAIVASAVIGSIWVIISREGGEHREDRTRYESLLLVAPPDGEGGVGTVPGIGHVGKAQLWMSCWRGLHPAWLLGLRLVAMVTMIGALSWDMLTYDASILVYYTEWTFTLVIVYFAIATLISAHGCWIYSKQQITESEEDNGFLKSDFEQNRHATLTFRKTKNMDVIRLQSHHEREVTEKRAGFWGYTLQIVYQTSASASVLTDVVFWGLLVPFLSSEHFSLNLIMGCMHSLNVIFLLLDTALNDLPFPAFRMAYFVLWSCTYVIFQWILHACGFSWWPYPFLELATPWAPLWYFCMALIHIPCYALYWLIVKAKNTFLPKVFPDAFVRSS